MTERETLTLAQLAPVFEAHAVPNEDRRLVYRVLDALMEEDCSHATAAECVRFGVLSGDVYEDILASWGAGHRGIRTWFRQARCYEQVAPTARGRSLLRDLAEINPDWQDQERSMSDVEPELVTVDDECARQGLAWRDVQRQIEEEKAFFASCGLAYPFAVDGDAGAAAEGPHS